MTIRGFFFFAATALVGVSTAGFAAAQSRAEEAAPTARVSYADLDTSRPADARVLMARLRHAAAKVCGRWEAPNDLQAQVEVNRCMHTAIDGAVAQLNAPTLAALRSGARPIEVAQATAPGGR